MDGKLEKMDRDYSSEVESTIAKANQLISKGNFEGAIEVILNLEKQTRNVNCFLTKSSDVASTTKLLVFIVESCFSASKWELLKEMIVTLSKKRGQLKQAIVKMINLAMGFLEKIASSDVRVDLLNTLRNVTEGKIFLEVERARLTKILSSIKEKEGDLKEATALLHELQVETFGSMDRREKTDFLLEQMRLGIAIKDFVRTEIISRKISIKFFQNVENQDLKLRYYDLMVLIALHDSKYLNCSKYYIEISNTPSITENETKHLQAIKFAVLFGILASFDNEQACCVNALYKLKQLEKIPLYKSCNLCNLRELLKCFLTKELMRWPRVQEVYHAELQSNFVFDLKSLDGMKRWNELHSRIIEHNIRIISEYYSQISFIRLTQLLDLSAEIAEEYLSKLMNNKTIYCKIDRPASVVSFKKPIDSNEILNQWSSKINDLLSLIVKTNHLIAKEEMVEKITQKI